VEAFAPSLVRAPSVTQSDDAQRVVACPGLHDRTTLAILTAGSATSPACLSGRWASLARQSRGELGSRRRRPRIARPSLNDDDVRTRAAGTSSSTSHVTARELVARSSSTCAHPIHSPWHPGHRRYRLMPVRRRARRAGAGACSAGRSAECGLWGCNIAARNDLASPRSRSVWG
jgi:hypothetical protein